MGLFDQPLVCVDIETDGYDYHRGHVIEVAAIRIENREVTDEFTTLVNPESPIPYQITKLTGIRGSDLVDAPTFDQVAERLEEILRGAIFVAHNVRFDYSFLKQEFKRVGMEFRPQMMCTVKLSRRLYPAERSHKLASLIERHNFQVSARHRAYDDANVLVQFLHLVHEAFDVDEVAQAIALQLRSPSLPQLMEPSGVVSLPNGPGVYIFRDEQGAVLYVGKSVTIKKRVRSHFTRDSEEYKEFKMAQLVKTVEAHETPGELSALLLESHLVKTLQPIYNRQLRRQRQFVVVQSHYDTMGYITFSYESLSDITPDQYSSILGIYPNRSKAKASVLSMIKTYDLCPKLCGLEKARGACFSYQLGKCSGACVQEEAALSYNSRVEVVFESRSIDPWPYQSAVTISEDKADDSGIIVDQWRIIGTFLRNAKGKIVASPYESLFDVDAYKILRAFLSRKADELTIKPYHQEV